MKGDISLGDFIHEVKRELLEAQRRDDSPFYELQEVQLEVTFSVDVAGSAGAKLLVMKLESEAKAQQVHKVTLRLVPLGASREMAGSNEGKTMADASTNTNREVQTVGIDGEGVLSVRNRPCYKEPEVLP